MKRLYLLRHAKTEQANKDTPADVSRVLTETGRRDALKLGRAMRTRGYVPDLILCSPSARTRQTLHLANTELRSPALIDYVDTIYAASATRLLALFRGLQNDVQASLLVGHNPGLEDCAALLVNPEEALDKTFAGGNFPTSGLLVLNFEIGAWKELAPHIATVVDFIRPKDLPD